MPCPRPSTRPMQAVESRFLIGPPWSFPVVPRSNGSTVYHASCSCMMGNQGMSVVDDQLRVHGLGAILRRTLGRNPRRSSMGEGDRWFESISLQRRVRCEPDLLDQGHRHRDRRSRPAARCRVNEVSDLDRQYLLRQSVYVGLREDKPAAEVRRLVPKPASLISNAPAAGAHPLRHRRRAASASAGQPGQRSKSDRLTPKVLALVAEGRSYRLIGRISATAYRGPHRLAQHRVDACATVLNSPSTTTSVPFPKRLPVGRAGVAV
jgi:hypothetical protein